MHPLSVGHLQYKRLRAVLHRCQIDGAFTFQQATGTKAGRGVILPRDISNMQLDLFQVLNGHLNHVRSVHLVYYRRLLSQLCKIDWVDYYLKRAEYVSQTHSDASAQGQVVRGTLLRAANSYFSATGLWQDTLFDGNVTQFPEIVKRIRQFLIDKPGMHKHGILERLQVMGFPNLDTRRINSLLYTRKHGFCWEGRKYLRLWYVRQQRVLPMADQIDTIPLHNWQIRALKAWEDKGRRGVVEAVTGSGKTRIALAAMLRCLQEGRKVAVIVPTKDLMDQWKQAIKEYVLPHLGFTCHVATLGDGELENLDKSKLVVALVQSAYRRDMKCGLGRDLIIADECHRYGSDEWSKCLDKRFAFRLGLTATFEREDNRHETILAPFFGGICYQLFYPEALRDDIIAHFKIAFVGTNFPKPQENKYQQLEERARVLKYKLCAIPGIPTSPFADFIKAVAGLSKEEGYQAYNASEYLSNFQERRQMTASSPQKMDLMELLAPAIRKAERTIVFTQTKDAAEKATERLRMAGLSAATLDSDMHMNDRRKVFAAFEDGEHDVVAAPKLLDEGIDVPEADLAIIIASSRSKRQLIQRMGRVIRKKKDGRLARLVVLYIANTCEDPQSGAHEDFIDMVTDVATATRYFPPRSDPSKVVEFLNDYSPPLPTMRVKPTLSIPLKNPPFQDEAVDI